MSPMLLLDSHEALFTCKQFEVSKTRILADLSKDRLELNFFRSLVHIVFTRFKRR